MTEMPYRVHIRQGEFELDVEGDRAFVETYIEAFLAEEGIMEMAPPPEPVRAGKAGAKGKKAGRARAGKGVPTVDKAALKAHMAKAKPSTNKERYLHYTRFWKSAGIDEVSDAHIQACFTAEGLPLPPTGRQNFSTLRGEGLIAEGSRRGSWRLTAAGEKPGEKAGRARAGKGSKGANKAASAKRASKAAAKGSKPEKRSRRRRKAPKSVAEVMGVGQ